MNLDIDDFPVGSLVRTPTGRVGVIIKHIWGDRDGGDFPRCSIRYLDSIDCRECARLRPQFLTMLIPAPTFAIACDRWRTHENGK